MGASIPRGKPGVLGNSQCWALGNDVVLGYFSKCGDHGKILWLKGPQDYLVHLTFDLGQVIYSNILNIPSLKVCKMKFSH